MEDLKIKKRRLSATEKNYLYKLFNGKCAYCGNSLRNMSAMQVDHRVPLQMDGVDAIENMYPTCKSCYQAKQTMDIEMFREHIAEYPNRLKKEDALYNAALKFGLVETKKIPVKFYFENNI